MKSIVSGFIAVLACLSSGCYARHCVMNVRDAVPAHRLPCEFRECSRQGLIPIDLASLSLQKPDEHRIGAGDMLGIYVAGVLPPKVDEQPPFIPPAAAFAPSYYPPYGRVSLPSTGLPVDVLGKGMIRLPLVGKIDINDLTIEEATDKIRAAYQNAGVIQKDRDRVLITLIRPRVNRVVVMREDSQMNAPTTIARTNVPYTKIGSGQVIDLPAYENDVLHALAASGGLPGIDVFSEVWIFRNRKASGLDADLTALKHELQNAESPEAFAAKWEKEERQIVRIPLRVPQGAPLPFTEEDIVLNDGDVVYLPPREVENFYVGGTLVGGRVPLPRDRDIDILEAIALANGNVGGSASSGSTFRTGPGAVFPPTQGLVLRKLPNGQQLRIRVDLSRALHYPDERILIHPEDQLFVFYKPGEFYGNILLNYVGFSVNIVPK